MIECSHLDDPVHRAHYYHKGYPLHIRPCTGGELCTCTTAEHKVSYQHYTLPFVLKVPKTMRVKPSQTIRLCYYEKVDLFVARSAGNEPREVKHNLEGLPVNKKDIEKYANEIIDTNYWISQAAPIGWEFCHLVDAITCKDVTTNKEYLLECKNL